MEFIYFHFFIPNFKDFRKLQKNMDHKQNRTKKMQYKNSKQ